MCCLFECIVQVLGIFVCFVLFLHCGLIYLQLAAASIECLVFETGIVLLSYDGAHKLHNIPVLYGMRISSIIGRSHWGFQSLREKEKINKIRE